MWIEWVNQLINLNNFHVIRCEPIGNEQWIVEIVPIIREGKRFIRYFDSETNAREVFESIKNLILHRCHFDFGIPC